MDIKKRPCIAEGRYSSVFRVASTLTGAFYEAKLHDRRMITSFRLNKFVHAPGVSLRQIIML